MCHRQTDGVGAFDGTKQGGRRRVLLRELKSDKRRCQHKADKFAGTDAYMWGVPCDFTYNFSGKDHTVALPEDIDLFCGTKVRFGVRTGNSHKGFTKFERPVLVIGIDGADDSFIGSWLVNIVEAFGKKLQDIINLGQDQYWDWCEANGVAY